MTLLITDPQGLLKYDPSLDPLRVRLVVQVRSYAEGVMTVGAGPMAPGSTATATVHTGELALGPECVEPGVLVDVEGFYDGNAIEAVSCKHVNNLSKRQMDVLMEVQRRSQ